MIIEVIGMSDVELLFEVLTGERRQAPLAYAEALQRQVEIEASAERIYDRRSRWGEVPTLLETEREALQDLMEEVNRLKKTGPVEGTFYNMALSGLVSCAFAFLYSKLGLVNGYLLLPLVLFVPGAYAKDFVISQVRRIFGGPLAGAEIQSLDPKSLPDRK